MSLQPASARIVTEDRWLPGPSRHPVTGWFHADGFGLDVGNDAAANDAALAQATAAMSPGDTLFIPAGRYTFGTWAPTKAIRVVGGGTARVSSPQEFGSIAWTSGTEVAGVVLQSTATSGVAVSLDKSSALSGSVLENLVIAGPGSGTSVGLSLGAAGGIGYPVRVRLSNVTVGNFSTGVIASCENSTLHGLTVMGCGAGLQGIYPFNGNTVTGLDVERCTGTAVSLASCDGNLFAGGVIQGNKADGLVLSGGSYSNLFTSLYVENIGTGTYDDVRMTDAQGNELRRVHLKSTSGTPRITLGSGATGNLIMAHAGYSGSTIPNGVVLTGSSRNRLLGNFSGAVTDLGNNVVERNADEGAIYAPSGYTGSALSVNVAATWQLAVMTGGGQAFHLPDPTGVPVGRVYRVKNATANTNNTVDSQGTGKTIDGATSVALAAWQARSFLSDGTQWLTI